MEIYPLVPPNDGGGLMSKIMGGHDLTPNGFPFLVRYSYEGNHLCGGAIINSLFILTAAHCLIYRKNEVSKFKVTAGDHDRTRNEGHEQERNVSVIYIHEDFNTTGFLNDIALLKLSSPLTLNSKVKPVNYHNVPTDYIGRATVSGWGKVSETSSSHKLAQRADINLQSCPSHFSTPPFILANTMMCAGEPGLDACQGDSGGPLSGTVITTGLHIVVGIASKGTACIPSTHKSPGIYTNVSKFGRWIDAKISGTSYSTTRCTSSQYHCLGTGKCIKKSWLCDNDNDCGDNEDESNCYKNCDSTRKFICVNSKTCIPSKNVCDGKNNCKNNQDEKHCDKVNCTIERPFKCRISGKCIPKSWVCDGDRDCAFSEDEEHCYG